MKKIMVVMVMLLIPTLLRANNSVDFEVTLIGVGGEIDHYPLEFETAVLLKKDIGTLEFINKRKISLSEKQKDELNQTHRLEGQDLKMTIRYNVVLPSNPYFKPYPGFENIRMETTEYAFPLGDQTEKAPAFDITVRTDAWGTSSVSGSLVMDLICSMVMDSKIPEKKFTMQDDGVEYLFEIRRASKEITSDRCTDGSCQRPEIPDYQIVECDGTCVMNQ